MNSEFVMRHWVCEQRKDQSGEDRTGLFMLCQDTIIAQVL